VAICLKNMLVVIIIIIIVNHFCSMFVRTMLADSLLAGWLAVVFSAFSVAAVCGLV